MSLVLEDFLERVKRGDANDDLLRAFAETYLIGKDPTAFRQWLNTLRSLGMSTKDIDHLLWCALDQAGSDE